MSRYTHPLLLIMVVLALAIGATAQAQTGTQTPPTQTQPGAQQRAGQAAQQQDGEIGRLYLLRPLPGHGAQLEEGLRRHMQFHQQRGDKFRYFVWSVETGPDIGNLLVGTFGHRWGEFDEQEKLLGEQEVADIRTNITPHVEQVSSSFWRHRSDLSGAPETGQPSRFLNVIELVIHPTRLPEFEGIVRQINDAFRKFEPQGPARTRWYQLINGGTDPRGPMLAIVQQRDSWSEFAPTGMSPMQALQKALGEAKGRATWRTVQESIQGAQTFVLRYRPDLSTRTAAQ